MSLLLSIALLCSDVQANPAAYQRRLMHHMLVSVNGGNWNYECSRLIKANTDPDDPCGWRGVRCKKGTVTHLLTSDDLVRAFKLRIDMLPSSIAYLHLHSVILTKSWVALALPRELRYMYLVTRTPSHSPELTRLPWYMKELHLYQTLSGTIDLWALPANMTMLNVFGRIEVIALVNNETLPAPLKGVRFVDRGGKGSVKLVPVNGGAVDPRVKKAHAGRRLTLVC